MQAPRDAGRRRQTLHPEELTRRQVPMHRRARRCLAAALLLSAPFGALAPSHAQTPGATPRPRKAFTREDAAPVDTFDVLGVKLGDTPDAVRATLTALDPHARSTTAAGE